jgi:hypothetical protein
MRSLFPGYVVLMILSGISSALADTASPYYRNDHAMGSYSGAFALGKLCAL